MTHVASPAIDISSEVAQTADEVWCAVTTPRGVNAELAPFIRMTFPQADLKLTDAALDTPLFGSWILLFGLLPFDRHTFVIHEIGARYFIETSRSLLQKLWRHERSLTQSARGTIIRDVVTVTPRFSFAAPLTGAIVRAIFRHRHKRLARLYGGAEKKAAGSRRRPF